ncbi:hypothetical protein LMG27177_05279 [Paraburkholderia fynbosensis]|uniref:Uncharacterized protein n=1 Tax=Paraburkholderia fynbosensis TaxID=1200993 RepID=A0A6J5GNY7_9BURK|nr:hypothetical protein LMG27177_05279 [Paraburkholderia fynbosensis]
MKRGITAALLCAAWPGRRVQIADVATGRDVTGHGSLFDVIRGGGRRAFNTDVKTNATAVIDTGKFAGTNPGQIYCLSKKPDGLLRFFDKQLMQFPDTRFRKVVSE